MPRDISPIMAFARRADPDRFLCTLFAPAAVRETLCLLMAFNYELARARTAARNPMAALIRLQWWRDAVAEAAAGAAPRRHEVAEPLHAAIRAGRLPAEALTALIDAREIEIDEDGISSSVAFGAYLRGTAGGLAVLTGRVLAAPGTVMPCLEAMGAAYGQAGVLRSVGAHAAQGRCLLPVDALARHGLSPHSVMVDPSVAGPVLRDLARSALAALPCCTVAGGALAAALLVVLARRDLVALAAGRAVAAPRGVADRLAVAMAGIRGRVHVRPLRVAEGGCLPGHREGGG
ncbi:squalene/phytoene synthase family protein [Humitalea sp. 24SJ18S-53]|uniref:squalene/phytoene synthase family protein n=1 Tax=Humitalea sp. 24SJ18S-53 TaxID=3422307 RepID=UPI003D666639